MGRPPRAAGPSRSPTRRPASTIKEIADASAADGIRALDAAVAAQDAWAATAPRQRGELLRRAFDLLQERKEDFALLMTLEMGKPLAEARGEVAYGGEFLRWFSEEAVRITGRYGLNPEGTGRMIVSQRPVGPSFFITPWNFPLAMATRKIAPALAAGCTVVIKPPALTPAHDDRVRAAARGGRPARRASSTSSRRRPRRRSRAPIIADPRLRKLSFTGSTEVGRALMQQAAQGILRTSMELGGNAPFVVFEDADLDKAVDGAMIAKFRNIGQACTAANRFLVHESVADEFAKRVADRVKAMKVGRGTEDGVNIGPLIDEKAVASTDDLVQDAVGRGRHRAHRRHPHRRRRHVLRADGARGRGGGQPPAVRGDLRPGARHHARSPTRTRRCASRTTRSTASSPTCSRRTWPAATA